MCLWLPGMDMVSPTNTASSSLWPVHALEPYRSLWLYEYNCTLLSIQFNSVLLFKKNLNWNFKKYLILLLFLKILSLFAFSYLGLCVSFVTVIQ